MPLNSLRTQDLSVLDVLRALFPGRQGTADVVTKRSRANPKPYDSWPHPKAIGITRLSMEERIAVDEAGDYALLPKYPFAFSALLLDLSGAYHHILAAPDPDNDTQLPTTEQDSNHRARRVVFVDRQERQRCRRLAEIWRADLNPHNAKACRTRIDELAELAQDWWSLTTDYGAAPVYQPRDERQEPPEWWRLALRLFMTSDEAASGAGFVLSLAKDGSAESQSTWFVRKVLSRYLMREKLLSEGLLDESVTDNQLYSFSEASSDIACVMPKARTTPVGCTLRSLSQHLALLPARGVARARWTPFIYDRQGQPTQKDRQRRDNEFNVLLIPYPFSVTDADFSAEPSYTSSRGAWSFFKCRQTWLHHYGGRFWRDSIVGDLANFIFSLAAVAKTTHGAERIDAVVLPELALDYQIYEGLRKALPHHLKDLRVLISGLSTDREGREGNFVGVTTFLDIKPEPDVNAEPPYIQTIREKHHRWLLEAAQITDYGLEGVLDPRRRWWEQIDLVSRRVDFTVFQPGSVLSVMICEDLARVDPCQALLRAVGPNLVIALLFDAPQLRTRWPARYATILAEDPGSSVLTLTSRGLMARQRLLGLPKGIEPTDPAIALWRDDHSGITTQITCGYQSHGIWLKLFGNHATDTSLDGRADRKPVAWIYAKHRELVVPDIDTHYPQIVGEADRILRQRLGTEP